MNPRILIILLAIASVGTTVLLAMIVLNRPSGHSHLAFTPTTPVPLDPPVLYDVPEFSLTERSGKPVGTEQLQGRVWVAGFVFTRCMGACPMMTQQMAQLQKVLQPQAQKWRDIRLVSFSVDPTHDTPEVLREYAESYGADPEHWLFATGTREAIWGLSKDGFKLSVVDDPENLTMPIAHSQKLALVDRDGRIRGYYEVLEAAERTRLLADIDKLLAE